MAAVKLMLVTATVMLAAARTVMVLEPVMVAEPAMAAVKLMLVVATVMMVAATSSAMVAR
jgi:hypothetical protein